VGVGARDEMVREEGGLVHIKDVIKSEVVMVLRVLYVIEVFLGRLVMTREVGIASGTFLEESWVIEGVLSIHGHCTGC
jgi:hypothetical protein